jgi:hypothetical protein
VLPAFQICTRSLPPCSTSRTVTVVAVPLQPAMIEIGSSVSLKL